MIDFIQDISKSSPLTPNSRTQVDMDIFLGHRWEDHPKKPGPDPTSPSELYQSPVRCSCGMVAEVISQCIYILVDPRHQTKETNQHLRLRCSEPTQLRFAYAFASLRSGFVPIRSEITRPPDADRTDSVSAFFGGCDPAALHPPVPCDTRDVRCLYHLSTQSYSHAMPSTPRNNTHVALLVEVLPKRGRPASGR